MNIEQKELINIIREELAEALGMDAQYDRQNLTMKVRDLLDEYTGDDLEAAYDTLTSVQAMLRYEMDQAAKEDEEYGSGRDKVYDDEEREARRAGPSQSLSPEEQEDYMKLYNINEDFFSDSAEEESAEADEEAAETAASASYVTGQGSGVKEEEKPRPRRKYSKSK
jgi:hypothetical protein